MRFRIAAFITPTAECLLTAAGQRLDKHVHLIRQLVCVAGSFAKAALPDESVFHTKVDEYLRRGIVNPRLHFPVDFFPDGTEIAHLAVMPGDELSAGHY